MSKIDNFIIKRDEHIEDSALLMSKVNNLPKRGVIHIGAHTGEESLFVKTK